MEEIEKEMEMGVLWLLVIVTLLCLWWYAYFKWFQEWLWRKPKFLKILCSTGTPIVAGFAAYMFREQQLIGILLGLAFAGPLILVVGIHLVCFLVEAVKGPARSSNKKETWWSYQPFGLGRFKE